VGGGSRQRVVRGALSNRGLPPRDRVANHSRARGGAASVSFAMAAYGQKYPPRTGGMQSVLCGRHVGPLSAYPFVGRACSVSLAR
jgi:hypothetical protein